MDQLFLLKPGFEDHEYPDRKFYCWHCALIEGVLATFPALHKVLKVERVDWARPRTEVIKIAGQANQSLPLLILAPGTHSKHQTSHFDGRTLITDKNLILAYFAEKYGIPEPHP